MIYFKNTGDFTKKKLLWRSIQVAYLFNGEKFIGKIVEISLKSHIYDMYGKNFIGVAMDGLNGIALDKFVVIDMKVN